MLASKLMLPEELGQRYRIALVRGEGGPNGDATHIPLLTPHFTTSQFAEYVVRNPKIMPTCMTNQNIALGEAGLVTPGASVGRS